VIPTFNEAENIVPLLDAVLALPSGFDALVVDDGSPDGTAARVRTRPAFNSRVHRLGRPAKLGLGTAYLDGFCWALGEAYDPIARMDADFSHDPADLERLTAGLARADLTLGTRYMRDGGVVGWARYRELLSRSANFYARILTRVPLRDLTGGFKGSRRATLARLPFDSIRSEGDAFQIETTVRAVRLGARAVQVPIVFRERRSGVSKISRRIVGEAFFGVLRLACSRRRSDQVERGPRL
jgi:dolichol-phosphate mannosyltransferase